MTDAPEPRDRQRRDQQRLRHRYAACVSMGLREEAERLARTLGVAQPELEAHFRASHHGLDEWEPADFESFASLPPGRFDPRVFGQTTWWVDILRRPHRISDPEDFSTEHLHAVIAFIRAEAWRWADPPEFGDDDPISIASVLGAFNERIDDTPLMRTLLAEAERRADAPRPERGG
ncbi:hypothetical protein [Nocardioides koreensis]|uniref:hypothetical protein n=1 Tax=Nocardioides koreensis TaxID=433651 RepID=UPI0031E218BE